MAHYDLCQAAGCGRAAACIVQGVALCQAHAAEIGKRARKLDLKIRHASGAKLLTLLGGD